MGSSIEMRKQEEKWRTESDLDSLQRAEEIRRDPKRLAAAQALAKERLLELAPLAASDKAVKS